MAGKYPAHAYLYTPDKERPTTWKLQYKERVGRGLKVTLEQLGRAAAAFEEITGLPGNVTNRLKEFATSRIRSVKGRYFQNG
jgi:hypothetical protein